MALTNVDDYIAMLAAGNLSRPIDKDSISASVNSPVSLWAVNPLPISGAPPGPTAAVCTGALAGAVAFPAATRGTRRLVGVRAYCTNTRTSFTLRDRLAHMGGLSGVSTSVQAVDVDASDGALTTRIGASNYSEVEWFLEWYTATGATSRIATVTYTNHLGTTGRTLAITLAGSMGSSRLLEILPTNGDFIKSVQSVQLNASTGATGNFGVTATRPVHTFRTRTNAIYDKFIIRENIDDTGMAPLHDNGCFFFTTYFSSGTTTGNFTCRLQAADG